MEQICKFCLKKDIQEHVPGLAVDIEKAVATGIVMPVISVEEFNHLDIDTVANSYRLREPFDAVEHGVLLSSSQSTDFSSGTGNMITSTPSTPLNEGS